MIIAFRFLHQPIFHFQAMIHIRGFFWVRHFFRLKYSAIFLFVPDSCCPLMVLIIRKSSKNVQICCRRLIVQIFYIWFEANDNSCTVIVSTLFDSHCFRQKKKSTHFDRWTSRYTVSHTGVGSMASASHNNDTADATLVVFIAIWDHQIALFLIVGFPMLMLEDVLGNRLRSECFGFLEKVV